MQSKRSIVVMWCSGAAKLETKCFNDLRQHIFAAYNRESVDGGSHCAHRATRRRRAHQAHAKAVRPSSSRASQLHPLSISTRAHAGLEHLQFGEAASWLDCSPNAAEAAHLHAHSSSVSPSSSARLTETCGNTPDSIFASSRAMLSHAAASAPSLGCRPAAACSARCAAFGCGLTAGDLRADATFAGAGDCGPGVREIKPATLLEAEGSVLIPTEVTPALCGECCRMYWRPPLTGDISATCSSIPTHAYPPAAWGGFFVRSGRVRCS